MIEVANLLGGLEDWLQKNRPTYYSELAPGAGLDQIEALEHHIGRELPASFKEFLAWHDGQTTDSSFLENWCLMSCEEIASSWNLLCEWQLDGTFDTEGWWQPDWIPFLYDYTGNYCCIDTFGHFNGTLGQILYYWHDDNSREIIHESFAKCLETIVLSMQNGTYYYRQENSDYSDYLGFSEQNNPGYPKYVSVPK